MQQLCRQREYLFHVTPYHAEDLYVSDKESGAMIGIAPRYDVAPRFDQHAIAVLQGKQAHDLKLLSDPIKERHEDEANAREAMIRWNAEVIKGTPLTDTERKEAMDQTELSELADAAIAEMSER
jgi:hypothetical protein